MTARLVSSPGNEYATEVLAALEQATAFTLVTAFATVAGLELVGPAIERVLERNGEGRIILAVDRRGFNVAAVFERLLALKQKYPTKLSINVALEESGLLHAKALFTRGPTGARLLVGSANLTSGALSTNHELGVLLQDAEANIYQAFAKFVTSIAPKSLDGDGAREFLVRRGWAPPPPVPGQSVAVRPAAPPIAEVIRGLPSTSPLVIEPEAYLAAWVRRGFLVGRGRRGLDALVLRLPREQLVKSGMLRPAQRKQLGYSSHETVSQGGGVDLVPTGDAETLRSDAARVTRLLAKVTLNLPCFGYWMPATYWDAFLRERAALQVSYSVTPERVRSLAATHREHLFAGGLEKALDDLLDGLAARALLVDGKRDAARNFLLARFRTQLALRTPEVLADCIEFRTARQEWHPYERTETPHRELMVDVVQATFSATYRTGDWPRRFRSCAARRVAAAIEARLGEKREADGATATELLQMASCWEDGSRPLAEVVDEFRRLVPDEIDFPATDLAGLGVAQADGGDDGGGDDGGDDEDGV